MNYGKLSMRKVLFQAFVMLTAIMCIHISIACMVVFMTPVTSVPWYAPAYLLGMIYAIPLAALGGLNLILWMRERL